MQSVINKWEKEIRRHNKMLKKYTPVQLKNSTVKRHRNLISAVLLDVKKSHKANEVKTSSERERLIHFLTESMKDKDSITIEQQVDTYLMNN